MPIYEYRCEQGHTFEVMQRISDDPVERCRECESTVGRVFHPVAVHFKGSGFYNTDYGKHQRGRGEGEGDAASSDGATSTDGASSDAKGKKAGDDSKAAGKDGASSDAGAKAGSSGSSSS